MHSFQKPGVCWYQLEFFDNTVTFPSQSRAPFADHTYVIQTVTGTFSIQLQDAICIRPSGVIGNLTYVEIGLCLTMVFCSTLGSEVSVAPLAQLLTCMLLLTVLLSSYYHWEK